MANQKNINERELRKLLDLHRKYLRDEEGGSRLVLRGVNLSNADLSGADLTTANLSSADLYNANLSNVNLTRADLSCADLSNADLTGAKLVGADLTGTGLTRANLTRANLTRANLTGADVKYADLSGANLRKADLTGADLADAITKGASDFPFVPSIVPDAGSFVGWKKAYYGEYRPCVVKLLIPDDAKRSSGMGRKCRCSKAKVLAIETPAGRPQKCKAAHSGYRKAFKYEVGKTVKADDFDDNRFCECAPGIHFFINREEAVRY